MPHRRKLGSKHTFPDGVYRVCGWTTGPYAREALIIQLKSVAPPGTRFRYIGDDGVFWIYTRAADVAETKELVR